MITTNSTVNLSVGFSQLGPNILGSTGSTTNGVFLQPFVQQLQSRSSSNLDRIASANSQSYKTSVDGAGLGAYDFLISRPRADGTGVAINPLQTAFDNDGSRNNNSLSVNTSVRKALGIAPVYTGANLANQIDGTVQFSNQFAFDFVAIAIHEIDHAIGFDIAYDVIANGDREFTTLNPFFGAIPEPETWAMLIVGFGFVGGAMRRRTTKVTYA